MIQIDGPGEAEIAIQALKALETIILDKIYILKEDVFSLDLKSVEQEYILKRAEHNCYMQVLDVIQNEISSTSKDGGVYG
jgi:hypothetical protein